MQFNLLKSFKEKFRLKIIAIFTFLIFTLTVSLTVLFYRHESREVTGTLIANNLLLAGVLAYNSRLGVFSESPEQLRVPMEGIFQQRETVAVAAYNLEGRFLAGQERPEKEERNRAAAAEQRARAIETGILAKLQTSAKPFFLEAPDKMEFWSPVVTSAGHREAELLFLEGQAPAGSERRSGFVRIVISKAELRKKLNSLLLESILVGLVFLAAGAAFIYWTVKRLTNPLGKLIGGVRTLEGGNFGGQVAVETEDEIGRLASAFNQMSATLLRREMEKKQIEERLRHSQRMEAIGTLAGGIAHDFNNILGVIVGNTEMALSASPGDRESQRCLREIFKAGVRARDLVRQILTFSRQGKQERHPSPIAPVIEEALLMMRVSLPATVEIRQDIKPGLASVLTDPTQIHQVVMNLCTNAGYAMQDGGGVLDVQLREVEIGAGDPVLASDLQPGRYQLLTVSDTGQGMEAAVQERIFDPFFTTKGPGKGTGMGLSVVHGIVKSHGGKITCESTPGRGTTFNVFFPTTEDKVEEMPEQIDSLPRGRERVLFVDDEAALADVGRQLLAGLGYDVVATQDSREALTVFRDQPGRFDLLITDNTMPNLTGMELVKNIRLLRPDLPIILCTGYSEGLADEEVRAAGIGGVLMKPIIRKNLARAVRQVLEENKEKV